jgi:NTE family protein
MTTDSAPKVGLALGGGLTFGFAHIGVLQAFREHSIPIDYIAGTSAGALVGACYAFGMDTDHIITASKELSWRKISDFSFSRLGIASNRSLATYVAGIIGDVAIEQAPIPLAIVATNIETREKIVLKKGNLGLALRASAGLPGLYVPTEIDGALLVDGGLVENVPLLTVKDMGATIVIGVNLQAHNPVYRPRNIVEILGIATTILTAHRDLHLTNRADILIEPDLSSFNATRFQDFEAIIRAGYTAALLHIPTIKARMDAQKKRPGFHRRLLRRLGF